MMDNPLVSVPVVTYNSSNYIVECLDSIYNQTYPNVELIISDDCSTDDTVAVCRKWVDEHNNRFTRVELLTVKKNTGIVANKTRAEKACCGDYIKPIDGDDFLDKSFIFKTMDVFCNNPTVAFVYTNSYSFCDESNSLIQNDKSFYKSGYLFKELFMLDCWIPTPSWIFKKEIAEEFDYDSTIWLDDYLRILKISNKYELFWIDEYLAYYRNHSSNSSSGGIRLFKAHLDSIDKFKNYHLYGKRREIILKYLSDCAEVQNPVYLIKMAFEYCASIYLSIYLSIVKKRIRAGIKKTKLFKTMRSAWLWKKIKREI